MRQRQNPPADRRESQRCGSVTVEYILVATLLGIGLVVGAAALKDAIAAELNDIATTISAIQ
jgi:Flp pilus assembly pilin Flp